jgi:protein ImuB
MSAATAGALASELLCLARDPHKEDTALQQLAQWAYRFSPAVSIKPPADLLLEVGASLKLFHDLKSIVQHIDKDLGAQGFHYTIGLAHTAKAAQLVARGQPGATPPWFDSKSQQLRLPNLKRALGTMPLGLLDLPPQILKRMYKPGFRTLNDILTLPRAALGKRVGRDCLLYLEQLLGSTPDPQTSVEPELDFRRRLDFLEPIHRSEALLFPMQRLLHELSGFLVTRQLDCPAFCWQLLQQDHDTVALPIRLSQPRHDQETLLALSRIRLECLKLAAPVAGLVLEGQHFSQWQAPDETLFEEWHAQRQSLAMLLDKLNTRLQPEQIYSLACGDDHVPERCWRRVPVTSKAGASDKRALGNRPGWLLQKPRPIGRSGNRLYWRGQLKLIVGPERIASRWWDQAIERDYFVARHQDGGCYWVYRDRQRQRWYLHGIFA